MEEILGEVSDALAAADDGGSAELAEPRVFGPAAAIRAAEYLLAAAGDEDAVTQIPPAAQTLVVPTTDPWPRALMVVTESPDDLQAPLLLTLVQTGPRDQYRLWSWARLFPGVEMPPTAQPEIGSVPVEEDAEMLTVPPTDVLVRYIDVLTNGDASEHAGEFLPDDLREAVANNRAAWTTLVGSNGSLTETYAAADVGPFAIATADGGAIVVGVVQTVTTIGLSNATLTISDQTAALVGGTTLHSNLVLTWDSVVVFVVPPEGSAEPVQVLGAEHALVQATGT